jgi:integrase
MNADLASSPVVSSVLAPAAADSPASISRTLHGWAVRFYKRGKSPFYTFDFGRGKARVQRVSRYTMIKDAEWEAAQAVRKWVDASSGKAAEEGRKAVARGPMAKVEDVLRLLERTGEDRLWEAGTARTYASALLTLARVVDAVAPREVCLGKVLTAGNIERFYALKQGRASVNWLARLPVNGGANSVVRNVKSIFQDRMLKFMTHLRLPDLTDLQKAHYLKAEATEFEPWEEAVYQAMVTAAEGLRATNPELWLVNAMLRRLGLRDAELLAARREWIELDFEWPADGMGPPVRVVMLVIKDRPEGAFPFQILKHGAGRRLPLDGELAGLLLGREGWLVGDGLSPSARHELIYRVHSQWMRRFVGEEAAKTNHQLRKYAGSKVFTAHGLEAAAYFLGDSISTTDGYYRAWLKRGAMLDGEAVARVRG